MLELLAKNLLDGILFGGILSLSAVGLTLIFGVLDIPNFAQGEFAMLGGYLTLLFMGLLSSPLLPAAALGVVLVFLLGLLCERLLIAPFYGRGPQFFVLAFFVTFGLSLFFEDLVKNLSPSMYEAIPTGLTGTIQVGFLQVGILRLLTFLVPIVILLLLSLFTKRTLLGLAMSAVAQDPVGARLMGIPQARIYQLTFGLGAALSAVTGILYGLIFAVYPTMGMGLTAYGFTIIIMGGVGSFPGTILASFIIGIIDSLTAMVTDPSYKLMAIFLLLILILTLRPQGLLGGRA